tara:strand:+ start:333 stop:506 length:174 start_codon:yes stop_codon:yes gene_type:complete
MIVVIHRHDFPDAYRYEVTHMPSSSSLNLSFIALVALPIAPTAGPPGRPADEHVVDF